MARNLDLTALRAFLTVAEAGGVTKASGLLHVTQSAVSMQVKRLEESVGHALFARAGRTLVLTGQGEELLSYARRMVELNDEIWDRMGQKRYEGELRLGVPHDIVYPHLPGVMQQFAMQFPKVGLHLTSTFTKEVKEQFDRGEADLILTTEVGCEAGGETIETLPLAWVGAPGGRAWRQTPMKLAFENRCLFRPMAQDALTEAGIAWEMGVESDSTRTIDASISADLAVHACLEGANPPSSEVIRHDGQLPALPSIKINMYVTKGPSRELAELVADMIRARYADANAA